MSKELLAGSRSIFSFPSIPNSQIFAFPCSFSLYRQGGGGAEIALSSPSPSVPSITVHLFKRKDRITEEPKNSCAACVPRYFPALINAHPALAVSQEIPFGCWGGVWSTTDMQTPSLQHPGADFGTARLMRDAQSSSGHHIPFHSWIFHRGS